MSSPFAGKQANRSAAMPLDFQMGRSLTDSGKRRAHPVNLAAKFDIPLKKPERRRIEEEKIDLLGGSGATPHVCETVYGRDVSDEEFYIRLQALKRENEKKRAEIETIYGEFHKEETTAAEHLTKHGDNEVEEWEEDGPSESIDDLEEEEQEEYRNGDRPSEYWITTASSDGMIDLSSRDPAANQSSDSDADYDGQLSSPLKAIEDMWGNFSVEEYAPFSGDDYLCRRSTSQLSDRPRFTVPEPFSMTVREEREAPVKRARRLKLIEELQRQKIEKEADGEAELRKKFRSRPMPATTIIPMYEEIKERNEIRRAHIRAVSNEMIKSTEKPFSFLQREAKRKEAKKAEIATKWEKSAPSDQCVIKARPVPREIFDSQIDEQIREEEEYRKIRIQMRAEEMLAAASLPQSMQVKGRDYTVGRLRHQLLQEREGRAFLTEDHQFQPRINQSVPDFDQLQQKIGNDLAVAKKQAKRTVIKPFYLRTALIPSRKEKVMEDIERDEDMLPENRWPFTLPRRRQACQPPGSTYIPVSDSMSTRSTASSRMRESANRSSLSEKRWKEIRESDSELRLAEKQKLLAQAVARRSRVNDHSAQLKASARKQLVDFKEDDWKRREEYQFGLKEMEDRLSRRPFLFERESQVNARRMAQKKYAKALQSAGFDEETVGELAGFDEFSKQEVESSILSEEDEDN